MWAQRGLGKSEGLWAVVLACPSGASDCPPPPVLDSRCEPSCPTEQQAKAVLSLLQPSACPHGSESAVKGAGCD